MSNGESPSTPARIVVVEDERVVALDIKSHLERFGYVVPATYASGEQALENIVADNPDLFLLDIRLQGDLDGVETGQLLQKKYGLPFILLTAYADEQTLQRAKITQPFAYIIKPFDERELRTSIVIALYRHKMERELSARQELLDTTLSSITDGVVVTDASERIEFMNRVAEELCGKDGEETKGARFAEVFEFSPGGSEFWPKGYERYARLLKGRSAEQSAVELLDTPLVDSLGRDTGRVFIIRDISERVEAERALQEREDQLRQSQKMEAVGRLSGGIAHDFNNLLTVILGYSKLLLESIEEEEPLTRADIKADVQGIQKAAFRSVALTRQLLAFSRHQVLSPRTISINSIVSEVEKMLRRLVSESITMHVTLNAETGTVLVDQGQMEQVLMNLVVNARDAMDRIESGSLILRTEEKSVTVPMNVHTGQITPGNWVVLHVQDNGTGISPEYLPHLFEPFFTTKTSMQGTGLGLATVYGIIRQMGGHIDVQSEVGRGTCFTVFLPRVDQQEVSCDETESGIESVSGSETVLLVEDEEPIRALLTRVLLQHGYHVLEAQNAGEAYLIAENTTRVIDLVVTDVVMPHVSGTTLAQRLRRIREGLRVLLISGYAEELAELDIVDGVRIQVLQKPFEPPEFVERVRRLLDIV